MPAVEPEGGDKAVIVIGNPEATLQHLPFGQVTSCFGENPPVPVEQEGCVRIDLFLLAQGRIGRALRELQIAQIDGGFPEMSPEIDFIASNGAVLRIDIELVRQGDIREFDLELTDKVGGVVVQ